MSLSHSGRHECYMDDIDVVFGMFVYDSVALICMFNDTVMTKKASFLLCTIILKYLQIK